MLTLKSVNHIAIIASDYARSLAFYTQVLGMDVLDEEFRTERNSMMARLALGGQYLVELFTFPGSPSRLTHPEACGLRHLAFEVEDVEQCMAELDAMGVAHEPLRIAPNGERVCFFHDPDGLPIELVENCITV